jgi:A/G-specific adenine glycosylase
MKSFSQSVIDWQLAHGRHHLPWQKVGDAYRIWLSEIMLQQTQVSAVIPYYQRFLERFPTLATLAAAPLEDVLKMWAGLGYYARARNLHRAAIQIMEQHGGQFPANFAQIVELPGVGRSTAGAVSVFAFGGRYPILDGNVRRVLARCFAVPGYPGNPAVAEQLWQLSENLLPADSLVAYTQGLMDLGSQICTRSKPRCDQCPLCNLPCIAHQQQAVERYPAPRPAMARPLLQMQLLMIEWQGMLLLEQRPEQGIWGGLWCLPHVPMAADVVALAQERWGLSLREMGRLPELSHALSHRQMSFSPVRFQAQQWVNAAMPFRWVDRAHLGDYPMPSIIQKLLIPS